MVITNPVLRGFHPDPSLVRVGQRFIVATSTFEWYPGVTLHESYDLARFRAIGHALTRPSQLNLRGVPDSGGIWAAGLSHDGRLYYLTYAVVRARARFPLVALTNWLVTAEAPEGPWSEPVALHGRGWDPFVFHDPDGSKWLLSMQLDLRPDRPAFGGIVMQRYDDERRELVGPVEAIFGGTALGCTEGPQLFVREGFYYLVTAEGGTSHGHAVTVARSRRREGPYEPDPEGPMLTSRDAPELPLQKAGHGSFVETVSGKWFVAHLCSRPARPGGGSPLGRETAIQEVTWTAGGWPRLAGGGRHPRTDVGDGPVRGHRRASTIERDDFDRPALGPSWATLRSPPDESWLSLRARAGWLRLRGRDPLFSRDEVSFVARRLADRRARIETLVAFAPVCDQQSAGLVCFHDTEDYMYLHVTWDEMLGRCLAITLSDRGRHLWPAAPTPLPVSRPVWLAVELDPLGVRFSYSMDGDDFVPVAPPLPIDVLADDHGGKDSFTGTMVGLAVEDRATRSSTADFTRFTYEGFDG